MRFPKNRRTVVLTALAVAASVALAAPSAAAGASTGDRIDGRVAAAAGDTGWLRLGHFSPDTKAVDVRISALSGGTVLLSLSDVGYGDISPYQPLQPGTYAVSMIAAGSGDWTKLAISDTVTVRGATASTVAAYGPSSALQLKAFSDDLTSPTAGSARIRVIQASTVTPSVDVQTTTGVQIASDAKAGSATPYAQVPAGEWTLQLSGEGTGGKEVNDQAAVTVAPGTVTTLFVLDTADGGLTILPVLDSAAAAVVPDGGVQTGGGWLAGHDTTRTFANPGARPLPV